MRKVDVWMTLPIHYFAGSSRFPLYFVVVQIIQNKQINFYLEWRKMHEMNHVQRPTAQLGATEKFLENLSFKCAAT